MRNRIPNPSFFVNLANQVGARPGTDDYETFRRWHVVPDDAGLQLVDYIRGG